jgi:WD40 repeat protein
MTDHSPQPTSRDRHSDQQYWQLWRQGQRPDLRGFLAGRPGLSPAEVASVIAIDQYERWLAGDRVPAEQYLTLLPPAPGLEQASCDIVYGEYLLREQLGEHPTLDEFQHRFPTHADMLQRQVQLHHALAEHINPPGFQPPIPTLRALTGAVPVGREVAAKPVIPGYEVLEEIGRGGMGVVYKARQISLGRIVALKILRVRPDDDPATLRRMRREAETLARMSHPHIVTVHDAGVTNDWFYFVMEYVPGIDLHRLVDREGPLPPAVARDYLWQAALGLQHAHEHGLVHRDIKPSNLIVTQQPGRSVLKILDLGLARAPDDWERGRPSPEQPTGDRADRPITQVGTFMGTPDFIAPEQASDAHLADIRSDLYSLGCTFHFALTGQPPFGGATPLAKLMQHHIDEPPALLPSTPPGLAAIIRKLMAKNPHDRFQTPDELLRALSEEKDEGGRMKDETRQDLSPSSFILPPSSFILSRKLLGPTDWVKGVAFSPDGQWLAAGCLDGTIRLWDSQSGSELGRIAAHPAGVLCLAFAPGGRWLASGGQDRAVCLWDLQAGPSQPRLHWRAAGHGGNINALAFLPGGESLLSSSHDGTLRLWATVTGQERKAWPAHSGAVWSVAVSPDGRTALSGGQDRMVRLWDLNRGEAVADWPQQSTAVNCVALSPDGRLALSAGGGIHLWDLASRREVHSLENHQGRVLTAAFSPDGNWLLSGSRDQTVRLFDVRTGRCVASLTEHAWWVTSVAWSPTSPLAASGGGDRTVCVWQRM